MKKNILSKSAFILSILWIILLMNSSLYAQKEVVRETRDIQSFDKIDAGGAFDVTVKIGEPQKVEVEAKQKFIGNISTDVKNGKLILSSRKINGNTPLNIYITVPALTEIEAHGAADIKCEDVIKSDMFSIKASGAASVDLVLDVKTLSTDASGASDIKLSGKTLTHSALVSGAATLDAKKLESVSTDADVSGAGTANVNGENVTGKTSGAGEIHTDKSDWTKHDQPKVVVKQNETGDTTYVHVPDGSVVVTDENDSVKVRVGNRVVIIDDNGEVKTHRIKDRKFNGHWAGVDIGLNGYVNKDFNMDFPKEYEYMDLRMEKSIAVNINFLEQNIPLAKNQKWGIVTGLGMTFNNYRFLHPETRLSMDSSMLMGYMDRDISIRKSKLTAMYLTLPVLFEFQTAPAYHKNGFHINVGVVVGARLSSHTKKYYNELGKEFDITQYNPETGQYEVVFTATSPEEPKAHVYGDWFLQPFKFDATARIGWDFLNFWANYSLNTMFRKGKGPELYPWSAGITLVCF